MDGLLAVELLELGQASVGWAMMASQARDASEPSAASANGSGEVAEAPPMRLRATITIDIDARDLEDAELRSDVVRDQFEAVKRAHPEAVLTFQRRKPRTGRRAPAPTLVVRPYADD